ncbi:MAG: alkaline phosphatase [Verrucomicrobiota bacterium]
MTWTTRITGFILILAFGFLAAVYMRYYVHPKEHAIILFIAPAVSPELFSKATQDNPLSSQKLYSLFNQSTIITSHLTDYQKSSPRELLSSLASGQLIPPGQVGYNEQNKTVDTLLYSAQRKARTVGIITTTNFGSAGASAFYTHTYEPDDLYQNTLQAFDNTRINVLLSAGIALPKPSQPMSEEEVRTVINDAKSMGYRIANDQKSLFEIPNWSSRLIFGAFGKNSLLYHPRIKRLEPSTIRTVSLASLAQRAILALQYNIRGYFLVVDDQSILYSKYAKSKNMTTQYTQDLLNSIHTAKDYAGDNLILCLYIPYQLATNPTANATQIEYDSLNQITDHSHGLFFMHSRKKIVLPAFSTLQEIYEILNDEL